MITQIPRDDFTMVTITTSGNCGTYVVSCYHIKVGMLVQLGCQRNYHASIGVIPSGLETHPKHKMVCGSLCNITDICFSSYPLYDAMKAKIERTLKNNEAKGNKPIYYMKGKHAVVY